MPTLITTPFGFPATAAEVLDGVDLSGKSVSPTALRPPRCAAPAARAAAARICSGT
jgi:hypothetical protein